jgi:raffinose/stachyose/melibiose transport system permease protein
MNNKGLALHRGYTIFLIPGVIAFMLIIVLPFLANIGISFTRWRGIGDPVWIGLDNYVRAFGDRVFLASFRNNLYLIIGMTVIPTIIGLFLATFLFDYIAKKFGPTVTNFFRAGFYLPQIIPVVVAAIVWRWIYQPQWGVLNTVMSGLGLPTQNWLGNPSLALTSVIVMLIWFQIGYPLVIFMAGLQRIDPELYEAASIDGASWLQRFFHITIHLIRPEIYVVVLTTTIHALKVFGPIFAMTGGGPGSSTMVASYFSYRQFFENANVGYGSTMATVLTAVIILVAIVFIRVQSQQERRESM